MFYHYLMSQQEEKNLKEMNTIKKERQSNKAALPLLQRLIHYTAHIFSSNNPNNYNPKSYE